MTILKTRTAYIVRQTCIFSLVICVLTYAYYPYLSSAITLACMTASITLSIRYYKSTRQPKLPITVYLLSTLIIFNIIRYLLRPASFTADIGVYLKGIQGYIYILCCLVLASFMPKEKVVIKEQSSQLIYKTSPRFTETLVFVIVPTIYTASYVFQWNGELGERVKLLTENNFEVFMLNILICTRFILASQFPALSSLPLSKGWGWLQACLLSICSFSLSGSLGILLSYLAYKNKTLFSIKPRDIPRIKSALLVIVINSILITIFVALFFYIFRIFREGASDDRFFYLVNLWKGVNFDNFIFGNGISSLLSQETADSLLKSSNLKTLLDSQGKATSLIYHSALMRVFSDTGFIGLTIVLASFFALFPSLILGEKLVILSPVFVSSLSVGAFFNPMGGMAIFLAISFIESLQQRNSLNLIVFNQAKYNLSAKNN